MLLRLSPDFGGDPNISTQVTIANDTGSNLQSVYQSELDALGFDAQTYQGMLGPTSVSTANGPVMRDMLLVEIMVLKDDGVTPLTNWILETGIVMPGQVGVGNHRLSGGSIRMFLYFATAPGNNQLFVARKKNGLVSQLPVV